MSKIIFFLIFFLTLCQSKLNAEVLQSVTFESGTYTPWTTGGATHSNLPTGGWDGAGAAQFTVPTSADSYSGIGLSALDDSQPEIYVRWVQKNEPGFHSSSDLGKQLVFLSTNGTSNRAVIIDHGCSASWHDLTMCAEIACQYENTLSDCVLDYECTTRKFNYSSLDGEWVCIEAYANRSTGVGWLKVTTRDGEYNETKTTYFDTDNLASGYNYLQLQILGNYGGTGGGTFLIDDLVIANTAIGPPTGFLGSVARTAAGVTFSGASFH